MNTLQQISLETAKQWVREGKRIGDGALIIARCHEIERRHGVDTDLQAVLLHCQSSEWKIVHGGSWYTYQLLVARSGVEAILDANGDQCGFRVVGTDRVVDHSRHMCESTR